MRHRWRAGHSLRSYAHGIEILAVLGGPGRHLHGHRGPRPPGGAGHAQAAVAQPRAVPRRGRGRHPPPVGPAPGCARHAAAGGVREDGHHGGHQRAAGAQGRAHAACHHARLSRRAAHRIPEPPAPVRPQHRPARTAVRARDRGAGAHRRAWRGAAAAGGRPPARAPVGRPRRGPAQRGHRLHAWLALHPARGGGRAPGARSRLYAGQRLAHHQPADEVRQPRRHHGGRCLPVAHPAALCGAGGGRDARRAFVFHAVLGRSDRGAPLPGQGRHPVRSGRRHRRHGAHGADGLRRSGPGRARDRLRHGRNVHRCQPLRGRVRARVRDPGGGRAHACAHDEHPHGGSGRRLHPGIRWGALSRRAAQRWRAPRPGQLPPRRAAGGDGCQRHGRQDPAGVFPAGVRPGGRRGAGRPGGAGAICRAGRADRPQRRGRGPRLHPDRRAADGQCHQEDLGGARLRRDALHAAVLWRRGRAARLPGGRCAGHAAGAGAPAGGRVVSLWHGPGRPERDARAGAGAAAAGFGHAANCRRAGRAGRGRAGANGQRAGGHRRGGRAPARAPALRGHGLGPGRALWRSGRRDGCVRGGLPPAFCLSDAGQGSGGGGGVGRGRAGRRRGLRAHA